MDFDNLFMEGFEAEVRLYLHDHVVQRVKLSNLLKLSYEDGIAYIQHKCWCKQIECDKIVIE